MFSENAPRGELCSAALNLVQSPMLWLKPNGEFDWANSAGLKFFGLKSLDGGEIKIFDKIEGWDAQKWEYFYLNLQPDTPEYLKPKWLLSENNMHSKDVCFQKVSDGGSSYKIILMINLSEKGHGQNLSQVDGAEFLDNIINSIGDPIFVKDEKHRWVLLNDSFCQIMNKPRHYLLGRNDYDLFPKEEVEIFWNRDEEVLNSGRENVNEELFTDGNGKPLTIITRKQLYIDSSGKKYIVGVSRDITELKDARLKLQKANEVLEQRVEERTAELKEANEEMEIRISHLKYLHQKGNFFAQLIDRDALLSAVFYSYVERFPKGEVQIVEIRKGELVSIHNTPGMVKGDIKSKCLDALRFLDADKMDSLSFEGCWMNNSFLKGIIPKGLEYLPCYLVIPLRTNHIVRGVVQIFAPASFEKIFSREEPLLNTLSSQAAISWDNANHYQELGERTRIQSELEIARGIQQRFTPVEPNIPGIQLRGICLPANEVGGDYLDYFQNEFGDWVIVIADVCGKGIPAALVMTSLRSTIRTIGQKERSSKSLLVKVNDFMGLDLQRDNSFITCMCLVINATGDNMNFTRAGHPKIVSYNQYDKQPNCIPCRGIALGMVIGTEFEEMLEEVSIQLSRGDHFVAYTDGLDEAMDANKQAYGLDRLMSLLGQGRDKHPNEIVDDILKDVKTYINGHKQYDDLTLFAMERVG